MTAAASMTEEHPGGRGRLARAAVAAVWVGAIVTWLIVARSRGIGPLDAAEDLRTTLAGAWWAPLLFVAVYVLRPVVLFPASVLTVLGGIVFGVVGGVVWTMVGSNLSTLATYAAGRYLLGDTAAARLPGRLLDGLRRRPFEATLIARLVALPFDAVGLAAGALRLRLVPFVLGSFLGTIAGTIAFVSFGASIGSLRDGSPSIDATLLIVSIGLTVAGFVVAHLLRRRSAIAGAETSPAT